MLIVLAVVSGILTLLDSMENALWDTINDSMGGGVPVSCPARFYVGEIATVQATIHMPDVEDQTVKTDVQFYTEQPGNGQRNHLCESQRLLVASPEGAIASCSFVVSESVRYFVVMVAVDAKQQVVGHYRSWGSCRAPAIRRRNIAEQIAGSVKPGWILVASFVGILITGVALRVKRPPQKHVWLSAPPTGEEASSDKPMER